MLIKFVGKSGTITVGDKLLDKDQKFEVTKLEGEALLKSKQHKGLFVKVTKTTKAKPTVSKPNAEGKPKAVSKEKKSTKKG